MRVAVPVPLSCHLTVVMSVLGHGDGGVMLVVMLVVLLWCDHSMVSKESACYAAFLQSLSTPTALFPTESGDYSADCTVIVTNMSVLQRFLAIFCDNWSYE